MDAHARHVFLNAHFPAPAIELARGIFVPAPHTPPPPFLRPWTTSFMTQAGAYGTYIIMAMATPLFSPELSCVIGHTTS